MSGNRRPVHREKKTAPAEPPLRAACLCRMLLSKAPILAMSLVVLSQLVLVACQEEPDVLPTRVALAPTVTPTEVPTNVPGPASSPATIPATFTAAAPESLSSPTSAAGASLTPRPSNTPFPTQTATSTITPTPSSTPTSEPTEVAGLPTLVSTGANLLPNPSFEEGWYHHSGVPELQVPNWWVLVWDEGFNHLDSDPWNVFVRPETRVLNGNFLPADEHDLFIWDGDHTFKVFKGQGAISFRLTTSVPLEPGTYRLEINAFPDMIESYTDTGKKKWASDALSGELQFIVDQPVGGWILPVFGQRNSYGYTFEVHSPRIVQLGAFFRGRWAIENNGWFLDNWSLTKQVEPGGLEG